MQKYVGQWKVETPEKSYTITQKYFGGGFHIKEGERRAGGASHFDDALQYIATWDKCPIKDLQIVNLGS